MRLLLSLVNKPAGAHDHVDAYEFTQAGGTIGRYDCDWVLPDPTTSRCHAEIQYTEGSFLIVDRSTNGVYFNDAEDRIGEGRASPLKDGDRLRIGTFEILVAIDTSTPPTEPSPQDPVECQRIPPDWWKGAPSGDENPAPTDPVRTIQEEPPPQPMPGGNPRIPAPGGARSGSVSAPEPAPPAGDSVPTEKGRSAPPPSTADGLEAALAALLTGAGVADLKVPGGATPELFRLIGEILALYAKGSVELLNAISAVKNSYRIEQTMIGSAHGNNPLRWVTPGAAVARLLGSHDQGYMPPAAAVADTMNSIKAHQIGVPKAMEAALQSFVHNELAPEKLKKRFDDQGKPRFLASRDAWYWEQYAQRYQEIAAMADTRYLDLLGAPFREEYELQVRPIRAQAKGAAAACD